MLPVLGNDHDNVMTVLHAPCRGLAVLVLVCGPLLAGFEAHAEESKIVRDSLRNGVGVGVSFHFPREPLNGGVGPLIHYRRSIGAAWSVTTEIGQVEMDRDATSVALEGELTFTRLSPSIFRRLGAAGAWSFALGGGFDWFEGSGKGAFISDPSTGITNDYDVDSAPGLHVDFEVSRPVGVRWLFFGRVGWLIVELDGTHRFVIDGVKGAPLDVTFDLSGPQLAVGAAWRF